MEYANIEWKYYNQFLSASFTQNYLRQCYQVLGDDLNVDELSYRNCYSFIYYLEHGKRHYDLAKTAPLEIQPVLLYYGMVQLLKCCLLTADPFYPSSTALLAHGVTTRKRKKQNYLFLKDEIKIQRNGLFPYFSECLFHMKQLEGDKFQMDELISQIPEMNDLFFQMYGKSPLIKVHPSKDKNTFTIPESILDYLHMTGDRFVRFLAQQMKPIDIHSTFQDTSIKITIEEPEQFFTRNLLFKRTMDNQWYIPAFRKGFGNLHEIMLHYLLLYNLSMICRYETEWWGELFHTYASNDYPFIAQFLSVSKQKVPYTLLNFLNKKK